MPLTRFFSLALKHNASDVHLVGGEYPYLRIDGVLHASEEKIINDTELRHFLTSLLTAPQKHRFDEELELDIALEIEKARFRINIHQQQGRIGMAARLILTEIPTPEDLGITDSMLALTELRDGLVLMTGPTGMGKSTTLASLIDYVNQRRKEHIITIEDPTEFIIEGVESMIEQREVGIDTHSFAEALKHVLRQDPNVILIGEMRDPETIATALTAAETGHLVFSTLHTPTAVETIGRIVDVFPGDKQKYILIQLASVLRGVIAQQLYPRLDGGRVAARELLIINSAARNLIRENNVAQLKSVIQTGSKEGMMTMEQSVKELVKNKIIDKRFLPE